MTWVRVEAGFYRADAGDTRWVVRREGGRKWMLWEIGKRGLMYVWGVYPSLREAQREADRVEVRA